MCVAGRKENERGPGFAGSLFSTMYHYYMTIICSWNSTFPFERVLFLSCLRFSFLSIIFPSLQSVHDHQHRHTHTTPIPQQRRRQQLTVVLHQFMGHATSSCFSSLLSTCALPLRYFIFFYWNGNSNAIICPRTSFSFE